MKLMASPCSFEFQVNRLEPKLIRPARPTPREVKLLSDIDDQEGLRFQVPVIMSYKNNHDQIMKENHDYYDPIMVIKEAVGRALVYYYPLAGRLREGPNRKLMVDCNGEGVLFIEANADVTLEQLGNTILPPCPFLEDFLSNVPGSDGILGCPLLLLQVTRLKCGGFIFALRVNHTMCDAPGLIQFFNAVGEMAQGVDAPSIPPVWRRELLNARDPPRITCMHHEYEQVFNSQGSFATMDQTNVTQLSLFFGPNEIRALRKQAPPHLSTTCSKFELITACLWKCRTLAFEMNREDVVRLSFTINARGKNYYNIHLPLGYYGNAFAFPAAVSKVEALSKNPLGYALELVKKTKAKMSGDYIRSVADLMVIRGRPLYSLTGNDFIVSDTTRARFGEVNFGWGKPVFAGPAKALSIISFYIHHKNKKDEDGILVPICLPLSSVDRFQHELKRMTLEPLEENILSN